MKWNMVFAMMIAMGSLTATAARAQDNAAASGATATEGQTATSKSDAYGTVVDEPATVDADGVPVAKPNPMSDFLKRARQQGEPAVEMPLVSDFRTDDSTTDGQPN
ncbi:MAG: hypothetical protein E6J64_11195 [Deltaproteobacteria bacterium]|nr:MAG: hypothetical protein E6J64_11195 [Deltaproteobacteria bacterium]